MILSERIFSAVEVCSQSMMEVRSEGKVVEGVFVTAMVASAGEEERRKWKRERALSRMSGKLRHCERMRWREERMQLSELRRNWRRKRGAGERGEEVRGGRRKEEKQTETRAFGMRSERARMNLNVGRANCSGLEGKTWRRWERPGEERSV